MKASKSSDYVSKIGPALAKYQRIANKNGVAAEEVARLTAQKVIEQAARSVCRDAIRLATALINPEVGPLPAGRHKQGTDQCH